MKNNKGITLASLIVTIIIMSIIIGITVSAGSDLFQKSKMTDYIGYMKLVKARADVVFEEEIFEAKSLTGADLDSSSDNNYDKMDEAITAKGYNDTKYEIKKWNKDIIASQGIDKGILGDNEYFVIIYNKDEYTTVDVFYSSGCALGKNRYYTLSDMEVVIDNRVPTT